MEPGPHVSVHAIGDDAELLRLPAAATMADYGLFSPDGSWLAVKYHDAELRVWSLSSRTQRLVIRDIALFVFTSDSRA
jgi:hypothetical protein